MNHPVTVYLPVEVYGHILLLAGNIPLLRSICKDIRKSHENEILRFNLTTPITKQEIIKYSAATRDNFWLYTQGNQDFIDSREFAYFKKNGDLCLKSNLILIYDVNKRYSFNQRGDNRTYGQIILRNNLNCDVKTIYNIVKNRNADCVKYLKSLLINTVNYYCHNSKIEFAIIYLYFNLCSFGFFMLYNSLGQYINDQNLLHGDLNYTKELLKSQLIRQINSFCKRGEKIKLMIEML